MGTNYYYLVAGLPDIGIEGGRNLPTFVEFIGETAPRLSASDLRSMQTLQRPYDNHNLLTVLTHAERPWDARGHYTQDELEQEAAGPQSLPAYMQTFIAAYSERQTIFPDLMLEDQLAWLFYEDMQSHGNRFLRSWFALDGALRNIMAGLACRRADTDDGPAYALHEVIVGRDDVAEQILRSSAADFSLSMEFPWITRLLQNHGSDLTAGEHTMDLIRWEALDELTTFSYFGIETLMAFALRLLIAERWQGLDAERGQASVQALATKLASAVEAAYET